MNSMKQLQSKVKEARQSLGDRIMNRQGKRKAQGEAETIFNELNLKYSKGIRDDYTIYYLSMSGCNGSVSLAIEYNSRGKVTNTTIY